MNKINETTTENRKKLIKETMFKLNMEPKYLGYQPFIDTINILYSNPKVRLGSAKKQISTMYNTTPSNIDKQIRYIISKARDTILNDKVENDLSSFFGISEKTFQIKNFSYCFIEYIKFQEKKELIQTEIFQNQLLSQEEQIIKKRMKLIKETMFKLNMPPHLDGFDQFIDIVLSTYETPIKNLEYLKLQTGKKHNKNSKSVDRDLRTIIRHAKKAISNNQVEPHLTDYFSKTEKPFQVKSFLYTFIEYIKLLENQELNQTAISKEKFISNLIEELNTIPINTITDEFIYSIINKANNNGIDITPHETIKIIANYLALKEEKQKENEEKEKFMFDLIYKKLSTTTNFPIDNNFIYSIIEEAKCNKIEITPHETIKIIANCLALKEEKQKEKESYIFDLICKKIDTTTLFTIDDKIINSIIEEAKNTKIETNQLEIIEIISTYYNEIIKNHMNTLTRKITQNQDKNGTEV